ncbi:MAG: endonuclease V [Bacteroidota bacterium]
MSQASSEAAFEKAQFALLQKLNILPLGTDFQLSSEDIIITIDIQYQGEWGYVAMDVQPWQSPSHQVYLSREKVVEDYISGYFAFREGPLVLAALAKLRQQYQVRPSLLIIDGHGVAHPRRMGLATWLGIKEEVASIGVAKDGLIKVDYQLAEAAGATFSIYDKQELLGYVLRTQDGIKPLFVSAGHNISQDEALRIVFALRSEYRLIEPIRRADQAARKFAKGEITEQMIVL